MTGRLTSRDRYLELLEEQFSGATGDAAGATLGKALRRGHTRADLEQGEQDLDYQFVHLRGARVLVSASGLVLDEAGVLWRGRISEVSGWHLGQLG